MPNKHKVQKLLKKIKAFLDGDDQEQIKRREKIIKVLRQLKKRTKAIERQLESIDEGEENKALLDELELIKAQRKKAIQLVISIKEDTES